MQRVMITGGPGSGKSTLARILGEHAGLPVHHMDQIHWKPGWVQREMRDRIQLCHVVENSDAWIFEGGFSTTYDHRAGRADTLIWLDLPVWLRFWRVLRRLLRDYGTTRPDMTENCPEVFHRETFAFWRWILSSHRRTHGRLVRLVAEHPHLTVHHLQSRSQVRAYIANLTATQEN
jgi:adenylate kinase family enzyme